MGWLREHSAFKITPILSRSASPFDEVPVYDLLLDREQEEWKRWANRPAALGQQILVLASQEMQARASLPRRRGKPASLLSYKEYKRLFLQEWAQHITTAAKKQAISQEKLAHLVSETNRKRTIALKRDKKDLWTGANWRELLRGQGARRMTISRLELAMKEILEPMGLNINRRGNMVTIWTRRLIASQEFENMALQFSPQFHHTEKAKIS